ncbi:MAG TPA: CAP domain-containing protein [Gaiellaceae bacterium]
MVAKRILAVAVVALIVAPAAFARRSSSVGETRVQSLNAGVLVQLNAIRTQHGLVPLTLNAQLSTAARGHSEQMLADGYFAHNSYDGSAFWKRMADYERGASNGYWSVGENLLWSSPTVDAVQALKLWMASPEHRANILTAKWRQIGIASVHAATASGAFGNRAVTVITTDFGVRG